MVRLNVVIVFALMACALVLMGCKDKEKEQVLSRAATAEMSLSKVKADLTKAQSEVVSLKEELGAAKNSRDELEQQVKQLASERDKAITAQTASSQEVAKKLGDQLNEQLNEQANKVAQVAQMQKTIDDQQTIIQRQAAAIEQLRKVIDGLRRAPAAGATEPNAVTPGQR